jgi:hypothetical protein
MPYLFICTLFSNPVFASPCSPEVYKVLERKFKIKNLSLRDLSNDHEYGNVVAEACQAWPNDPHLIVSAIAYDDEIEYQKVLFVAMIDNKSKQVISSYKSIIEEDVVSKYDKESLKLDMARYQLNSAVRAFGLRFRSGGREPSCADRSYGNELTLFVPEKSALRPVLVLPMFRGQALQGCIHSTSAGQTVIENADITLSIGKAQQNGFFDLAATAKIEVYRDGEESNTTASKTEAKKAKNHIEHHMLHYNGKTYELTKTGKWWLGDN